MWVIEVSVSLSTWMQGGAEEEGGHVVNVLPASENMYVHISRRPLRSEWNAGNFWHQRQGLQEVTSVLNQVPVRGGHLGCYFGGQSGWPVLVSFCLKPVS